MNRAKINSAAIVGGGDKRRRMEDSLLNCWHQRLTSRGLLCKNPGLGQLFFCSVACSNRGFYIKMQRSWSLATVVWVLMGYKSARPAKRFSTWHESTQKEEAF